MRGRAQRARTQNNPLSHQISWPFVQVSSPLYTLVHTHTPGTITVDINTIYTHYLLITERDKILSNSLFRNFTATFIQMVFFIVRLWRMGPLTTPLWTVPKQPSPRGCSSVRRRLGLGSSQSSALGASHSADPRCLLLGSHLVNIGLQVCTQYGIN